MQCCPVPGTIYGATRDQLAIQSSLLPIVFSMRRAAVSPLKKSKAANKSCTFSGHASRVYSSRPRHACVLVFSLSSLPLCRSPAYLRACPQAGSKRSGA